MYLMVGSACTLLAGAAAFYLLDYLKQAPMGTTINTIKDAIQQPGANGLENSRPSLRGTWPPSAFRN